MFDKLYPPYNMRNSISVLSLWRGTHLQGFRPEPLSLSEILELGRWLGPQGLLLVSGVEMRWAWVLPQVGGRPGALRRRAPSGLHAHSLLSLHLFPWGPHPLHSSNALEMRPKPKFRPHNII